MRDWVLIDYLEIAMLGLILGTLGLYWHDWFMLLLIGVCLLLFLLVCGLITYFALIHNNPLAPP